MASAVNSPEFYNSWAYAVAGYRGQRVVMHIHKISRGAILEPLGGSNLKQGNDLLLCMSWKTPMQFMQIMQDGSLRAVRPECALLYRSFNRSIYWVKLYRSKNWTMNGARS